MTPLVSVCIANYNGSAVIESCLDSVLAQVVDAPIEVIVYDDASTDTSLHTIRSGYPQVTLITAERNRGYSEANNRMADAANGRYLLLLNNDAWLEDGALQALCDGARETPAAILSLRQMDAATGALRDMGMGLDLLTVPYPILTAHSPALTTVIGACLWVERSLFLEAGGFPEWFDSVAEDLYLCLYARLRGVGIRVLTDAAYFHHSGHSFGGGALPTDDLATSYRRRHLSERNRMAIFLACFPAALILCLLPLWLLLWLGEATLLSIAQRSLRPARQIYLAALRDTLRNLPRIGKLRQRVNARRQISYRSFLRPFAWMPSKLRFLARHGLPRLE